MEERVAAMAERAREWLAHPVQAAADLERVGGGGGRGRAVVEHAMKSRCSECGVRIHSALAA
jgi:hypothetical protein